MGEARRRALAVRHEGGGGEQLAQVVDTLGGRMHVRWDAPGHERPLEFMQRLAALVPRPRPHLIRFHGVLAPNAKLRAMVVPKGQP